MTEKAKHKSSAGKGDLPRPRFISDEEYSLRFDLAFGKISKEEFEQKMKKLKGAANDMAKKYADDE